MVPAVSYSTILDYYIWWCFMLLCCASVEGCLMGYVDRWCEGTTWWQDKFCVGTDQLTGWWDTFWGGCLWALFLLGTFAFFLFYVQHHPNKCSIFRIATFGALSKQNRLNTPMDKQNMPIKNSFGEFGDFFDPRNDPRNQDYGNVRNDLFGEGRESDLSSRDQKEKSNVYSFQEK